MLSINIALNTTGWKQLVIYIYIYIYIYSVTYIHSLYIERQNEIREINLYL